MQALKVFWQPGCSSCVKVKEFLTDLGVPYESMNVAGSAAAMAELHALGLRTVPVVSRGGDYVFAQALEDVSRFVGLDVRMERLPPEVLMAKWLKVLAAAQRHIMQVPAARLGERATQGRDRSIRDLAYHVYQIPDAFLQVVGQGLVEINAVANETPPAAVTTVAQIRDYGARISAALERWWAELPDKSCQWQVKVYYGTHPVHQVLERCTWHSAQHARQIAAVLERLGIAPDGALTAEDYAGLPLPAGLWE